MKKLLLLIALVFSFGFLFGQSVPYNVVFDLTSKDPEQHKTTMRWLELITSANPDAKIDIVLYGQSLDMVVKDRSVVPEELKKFTANKNIAVKVCAIAMKKHSIEKSQLLPGIVVVQDGIYEIISRQKEGWGYIKAAN